MILYIKNYNPGSDDYFAINVLSEIIKIKLQGCLTEKNIKQMNEYLEKEFGLHCIDVIEDVCNNLKTSWNGNTCKITINQNAYNLKTKEKVKSLMKLIDYGNTRVKGLCIFRETLDYVKRNINSIHRLYNLERSER